MIRAVETPTPAEVPDDPEVGPDVDTVGVVTTGEK